MASPERPFARSRGKANRSVWFLGAYFLVSRCGGTMAFCTVGSRPWPSSTGGRSSLDQGGGFHGDVSLHSITAMGVAAPARRTEKSFTMKVKTHKGRKSPKARRGGPRTDAEGYSAEAFVKMRHEVALQVATSSTSNRRERKTNFNGGLDSCPCLVLNADYQPLSYLPLSLWGWQDVIKAVFMNKVTVLATYGDRSIRSPSIVVQLPSVIALKEFVNQHRTHPPFTRRNLFLRDSHKCQYCLKYFPPHDLSFDHVLPKKLGGKGCWDNVVTACGRCNNRKSDCHPRDLRSIGMSLSKYPITPSFHELQMKARRYPPSQIHETWEEFLYFEREILEDEQAQPEEGVGSVV